MSSIVSRLMSCIMIFIHQQHATFLPSLRLAPHWNRLGTPGSPRIGTTTRLQAHLALNNSGD